MVASSITAFEAGPSRLLTASRTVFCDLIRSCICDVRRNCRPQASRNLQDAIFNFTFPYEPSVQRLFYDKKPVYLSAMESF